VDLRIQTAVVLVGGAGLRMRPLTEDLPKAMINLHGKPLLHWTLDWLKKNQVKHIVLGVAYCKEAITDYMEKEKSTLKIDVSVHTVEGGTGEGFRLAIQRYVDDDNFFAMNGDELTNMNLQKLASFHLKNKPIATIAVSPMRSPFGLIETREDNIIGFREKPILEDKLVSTGVYAFSHKILNYMPTTGALEKMVFPTLAQEGLLKAYRLGEGERWITVNTAKDLSEAEKEFRLVRGI